jgi:hypothetical protein
MLTSSIAPFDPASLPLLAHDFRPARPRVSRKDFHNLFTFIWMRDTENFDHPRYRLQVALILQLFYYLGLHPTGALSDGLRYANTQILLKKYHDVVRVVLLIDLDDQKQCQKSVKHGRGYGV